VVEKIAYVMANPVAAGLVERAHHWPGVTTRSDELGRGCWMAKRPALYFDEHNVAWPANANLRLTLPPAFRGAAEELQARVADELLALERIFFHAVAALRQFRSAYRTALEAWRQGVRSVRFPFGTYLMSSLHGASVAEPS
jgi:putative transposase